MFDARYSKQRAIGLGFGLGVTALVAGLFFAALHFPAMTGPGTEAAGDAELPVAESGGTLEAAFSDQPTLDYIAKLRRTFPSAAAELETSVRRAVRREAGNVELGLIVLQAGTGDITSSIERLARADVSYLDALLDLTESQLASLRRSGAPYCMGNDLMMFAGLSEQQLYRAIFDRVGHGAGLYEYALGVNGILLDAIHEARSDPDLHRPLDYSDQQALQTLGIALMTKPEIVKLLTTEGKTRSEMDAVLAGTDFCALASGILAQIGTLPEGTKGRLWAEALRQIESGRWRYTLYRYTGY